MLLACLILLAAPVDTLDTFETDPGATRRIHRPYVIRMIRSCKGASWELVGTGLDSTSVEPARQKTQPDAARVKQEDHLTAWQTRRGVAPLAKQTP